MQKQFRLSEHAPPANARLKHRRRPQNLFCAWVQPHAGDRARLAPCFGSLCLNQQKRARMGKRFSIRRRASNADSFTHKIQPQIPHCTSFRDAGTPFRTTDNSQIAYFARYSSNCRSNSGVRFSRRRLIYSWVSNSSASSSIMATAMFEQWSETRSKFVRRSAHTYP